MEGILMLKFSKCRRSGNVEEIQLIMPHLKPVEIARESKLL
jgi:hypothetical protein